MVTEMGTHHVHTRAETSACMCVGWYGRHFCVPKHAKVFQEATRIQKERQDRFSLISWKRTDSAHT